MEKRNKSIQLMRVCACLMVFTVHLGQQLGLDGLKRAFTDFGAYGVQVFFLIAGFLAAKTFFGRPTESIKRYYIKRLIAILPLYYFVILFYFITYNLEHQFSPVIPPDELGLGWFRYIFLLNGFLNSDTTFWSNLGITWTIPIFIFFYIIAPWILRKIHTISASILLYLALYFLDMKLLSIYNCTIFWHIHIFFWGVILYACAQKRYNLHAAIFFSVFAICLIIMEYNMYVYISLFSCILLILLSISQINIPNWLQYIINALDAYSYTIYLVHGIILSYLMPKLNIPSSSKFLIAFVAIVGTALASFFVGKFIEKPIQQYLKKHLLN